MELTNSLTGEGEKEGRKEGGRDPPRSTGIALTVNPVFTEYLVIMSYLKKSVTSNLRRSRPRSHSRCGLTLAL